jgi:hypothetical protein
MRVYAIPVDGDIYLTPHFKDALYNIECELENLAPGSTLEIEVVEMTEEELNNVPEYTR